MLMLVLSWFESLFTPANLGYFILGVALASGWHTFKAKLRHREVTFRWKYVALPLVCYIALYISLQTQQNADCMREFQQVLIARSTASQENDRLSVEQRLLVYEWIHDLIFPPPDIAGLPGSDPRREHWAIDRTLDTDRKFKESIKRQQELDEYRSQHPLPDPTCGD